MAGRADNLPLAIGAMVGLTFFLSLGDAVVKEASGDVSLWQLFTLRSLIAFAALALLTLIFIPWRRLKLRAPGWVALRSALLVANWVAYYAALPFQPLALAAACYYTLPIFITFFSAIFLKDRVGASGWIAAGLGFAGVLLVLRPGTNGVNFYTFLPILAAILYALSTIVTRAKCREENAASLALALHVAFVAAGLLGSLAILLLPTPETVGFFTSGWSPITGDMLTTMAFLAVMILVGSVGTAVAYQNAPPARVAPFDFAYVGFAVLWGWVFVGTLPDTWGFLGIALIMGGGLTAMRAR